MDRFTSAVPRRTPFVVMNVAGSVQTQTTQRLGWKQVEKVACRLLRKRTAPAGLPWFGISAYAIASGIIDPAQLCLIAGSWSINEYINTSQMEAKELFMTSAYCLPGYWLTMEGSATSASNLEWVVSELMGGEAL